MRCRWLLSLFLAALAFSWFPAAAQLLPVAPKASASAGDLYGRDTPRGLSQGLLDALAAQDYERAGQYFDLSSVGASLRQATGATLARRLQASLDAGGSLIQPVALSAQPSGRIDDNLPPNQEQIGTLPGARDNQSFPLIATSVSEGGKTVWVISKDSISKISTAMALNRGPSLRDRMPQVLRETTAFGASVADWLLLLLVGIVSYLAVRFVSLGVVFVIARYHPLKKGSLWSRVITFAPVSLSLWIGMSMFLAVTRTLEASIIAKQFADRVAGAIALLAFAWFIWRMVDLAAEFIAARMKRSQRFRARSIIIFSRRALKLLILIVAAIQALKVLGLDVTTGIAALGIGGIAIALGAQKTVENVVGSVSVVADEPIRVGDYCKVGGIEGTVEEIGIRSTRIRTKDRTIITIPNGNLSTLQIENLAARDRFLVNPVLRLLPDATAQMVETLLADIRSVLAGTADLHEGARANFKGFGDAWIEVEVFAWIDVLDANVALQRTEQLLIEILRCVEKSGARLAGWIAPVSPAPAPAPTADADNGPQAAP